VLEVQRHWKETRRALSDLPMRRMHFVLRDRKDNHARTVKIGYALYWAKYIGWLQSLPNLELNIAGVQSRSSFASTVAKGSSCRAGFSHDRHCSGTRAQGPGNLSMPAA
jgi:hypothetical protein